MERPLVSDQMQEENNFDDILHFLNRLLGYWYWVAASCGVALAIAYLSNRYATSIFSVSSTLEVVDSKHGASSIAEVLYGSEVFALGSDVQNEVYRLKSWSTIEATIAKLDFEIEYYKVGNIRRSEVYKDLPIRIRYENMEDEQGSVPYGILFEIDPLDENTFVLKTEDPDWQEKLEKQRFAFNKSFVLGDLQMTIDLEDYAGLPIQFRFVSERSLAERYKNKLTVNPIERESSILNLSVQGSTVEKEMDFLKALMDTYIEQNLRQKNEIAQNTINFIDVQLQEITDSLNQIEKRLELFKEQNKGIAIDENATMLYENFKELEKDRSQLNVKDKYLDYLRDYIGQGDYRQHLVVPSILGVEDPVLNKLVSDYVQYQTELKLYENREVENPKVSLLRKKMKETQQSIEESIRSLKRANQISIDDLEDRIVNLEKALRLLPGAERKLINIQRLYSLSENIYIFLMEKKAEAGISKASNIADARVVDTPRAGSSPIKPKKARNYAIALALGLIIPIAFIYLLDLLNNKVLHKDEVARMTGLPFLGIVGHSKKGNDLVVSINTKSSVAETFRNIRTNLQYMVDNGEKSNIIVITSSVGGEGKTFCSMNLAYTMALSGKSTILIGGDMRKPNLFRSFGTLEKQGLSNYLAGMTPNLDDIIQVTEQNNLHLITAGDIPPNPAELLAGDRMKLLIENLKKIYHYIIIDTPPYGIVSDANELFRHANATIFIIRHAYTPKLYMRQIKEITSLHKVKNPAVLYNDVNLKKLAGYKYSYGYYDEG
ncbi:MAG: polysaccharide biosynthesis tyrosine autokinase [Cytophagales bacterium]|nr:polysaccharide biosynthesis tyrosine autokinase [Cytophagales bacterium]